MPDIGSEICGIRDLIRASFPRSKFQCIFDRKPSSHIQWLTSETMSCINSVASSAVMSSPPVSVIIFMNGQDEEAVSLNFHCISASHISSISFIYNYCQVDRFYIFKVVGFADFNMSCPLVLIGARITEAIIIGDSILQYRVSLSNSPKALQVGITFNASQEYSMYKENYIYIPEPEVRKNKAKHVPSKGDKKSLCM